MNSVSVVIPAYNAVQTIAEAIASARGQTHRPLEIIVVDDGSRDATLSVLASLAGPDLIVIRQPVNGGGSAARNRGIDAARGHWIAFLDSDDLWLPRKLETQLAALSHEQQPAFCFSNLLRTNEYGEQRVLPRRRLRPGESLADFMLKEGNVVQTSTLLVPREVCGNCRFREGLRRFQDIDFVLQLQEAHVRPVHVAEQLVEWRHFGGTSSVSSIQDPNVIRDFLGHHIGRLTRPQRWGLEVRSLEPLPGIAGTIKWLAKVALSVCAGALAVQNAGSLILKNSLGLRSYGLLRTRLGMK